MTTDSTRLPALLPACPAPLSHPSNQLVRTHITNSGAFNTKALRDGQVLQTEEPRTQLTVNVDKDNGRNQITIIGPGTDNDAQIIDPRNIKACKSFIHTINRAITPRA
jgi:hypothetical protein